MAAPPRVKAHLSPMPTVPLHPFRCDRPARARPRFRSSATPRRTSLPARSGCAKTRPTCRPPRHRHLSRSSLGCGPLQVLRGPENPSGRPLPKESKVVGLTGDQQPSMPHTLSDTDKDIWAVPDVEVVCRSWEELVAALVRSDTSRWWIFRGMGDATWDLDSSLTRVLKRSTWPRSDGRAAERSAIGYFKQQARGELRDPPDNLNLVGWLALMQHYGAPTRLLDWTMSAFVACYFAYESQRTGTTPPSGLCRRSIAAGSPPVEARTRSTRPLSTRSGPRSSTRSHGQTSRIDDFASTFLQSLPGRCPCFRTGLTPEWWLSKRCSRPWAT